MSTFNIKNLANERALITGTDDAGENHKVIVSTLDYNQREHANQVELAQEEYDAAVHEFYAPLLEAAEAANQQLKPVEDPAFFEVIEEGSEGVAPRKRVVHKLPHDTVILRLINSGRTDRLIWVDDTIEVLEYQPGGDDTITVPALEDDEDTAISPDLGAPTEG